MWEPIEKGKGPAYKQMMEQVIQQIEKGNLDPGQKLPPERKFAEAFQVNRSTAVRTFEELKARGILESRQGSGWYINQRLWENTAASRVDWRQLFSQKYEQKQDRYSQKILEAKKADAAFIDLYTGEMPHGILPKFHFPELSWEMIFEQEAAISTLGYLPLRERVKNYLAKGQDLSIDQLMITAGGQQAIFLILQTLLSAGDAIAVESPSFFYQNPLFEAAGIRLFGIPMDQEGMKLDYLEKAIMKHKIKMVMVNPNFQNPTAVVMSEQRRRALIDLCRKHRLPIVEDDVFSELDLTNDPVLPLRVLDPENVLYIGSLSRVLGKTTKIGWITAPRSLVSKLASAQEMMELSLGILPQLAAASLFEEDFAQKVEEIRKILLIKKKQLLQWEKTQAFFQVQPIPGGYYAWLTWNGKKMDKIVAEQALKFGLGVAPGYLFGQSEGMRINFSRLEKELLPAFSEKMTQLSELLYS
ncbi:MULTISPECIES: PLP-dependent aminotransferase family protein [unclassified Enterococcus]|jgi:GntR family transcriptional regulator of abcA and norABC|uniref:aminotransferase-like domain-containing protein n=1 Tax=unclassified Enterococcus TaxID=2608891 RepID=UPI003D2BD92A